MTQAMVNANNETKEVMKAQNNIPMGFDEDDDDSDDIIIPRVKIIQAMSPERKEKIADEGDIINSLTKKKCPQEFIPVFKYNNNVLWIDRKDGGGIACCSRKGAAAMTSDGIPMNCKMCGKNKFDNSKQGAEAIPPCTKYMNFLGFFRGERIPVILSFSKTNMAEGKKMFSQAKVSMENMFNYTYKLTAKEKSGNGNEWFIIDATQHEATTEEERAYAIQMYGQYKDMVANVNIEVPDSHDDDDDDDYAGTGDRF